ncbi:hypothetical protein BB560_003200 [Smittium megazygosporum]|uniref:CCHC-type domain-containing protein n=1 Tax=Smittium megazygosporum TaxID=133381 RepID=A0A2T9YJ25_9FUNG|nr:hypothetical protein BB560_006063 [Smittium megazygosporum]PVV02350.1 hypothetical protein BB560_003200 [Smittium megazygosporum]
MASDQRGIEAFEKLLKGRDELVQKGTCRKCGAIGHLTFECKNFMKLSSSSKSTSEKKLTSIEQEKQRLEEMIRKTQDKIKKTDSSIRKHYKKDKSSRKKKKSRSK